jgi:hypothetical protein
MSSRGGKSSTPRRGSSIPPERARRRMHTGSASSAEAEGSHRRTRRTRRVFGPDLFVRIPGLPAIIPPSVVSPKWQVFCGKGFSLQARRERRAYPQGSVRSEQRSLERKELPPLGCAQFGLSLRCSSVTAPLRGMLPPRASPQADLGATKHQPFRRHNTSA